MPSQSHPRDGCVSAAGEGFTFNTNHLKSCQNKHGNFGIIRDALICPFHSPEISQQHSFPDQGNVSGIFITALEIVLFSHIYGNAAIDTQQRIKTSSQ